MVISRGKRSESGKEKRDKVLRRSAALTKAGRIYKSVSRQKGKKKHLLTLVN